MATHSSIHQLRRYSILSHVKSRLFSAFTVFLAINGLWCFVARHKLIIFKPGTDKSLLTLLLLFLLLLGDRFKNLRLRRFKSDQDEIWQDCSSGSGTVAHWLAESDFWFDVTLHTLQDDDHDVQPPLAAAYAPASASCPLVCRAHVMPLGRCVCYSSWSILHSYLLFITSLT